MAPPPAQPAPQGYAGPPARRRRRWPSRILVLTLLTVVCCCGCPAYYGKPLWDQYPARATLPPRVADLRLSDDTRSQTAARRLETEMKESHLLAEDLFAGVYVSPQGKKILVFGSTGIRLSPEGDVEAELSRLKNRYNLAGAEVIHTDVRGEHQRCALGRVEGTDVVVCTWADHGSITTGVFPRLSVSDSTALLGTLREHIVTRG